MRYCGNSKWLLLAEEPFPEDSVILDATAGQKHEQDSDEGIQDDEM